MFPIALSAASTVLLTALCLAVGPELVRSMSTNKKDTVVIRQSKCYAKFGVTGGGPTDPFPFGNQEKLSGFLETEVRTNVRVHSEDSLMVDGSHAHMLRLRLRQRQAHSEGTQQLQSLRAASRHEQWPDIVTSECKMAYVTYPPAVFVCVRVARSTLLDMVFLLAHFVWNHTHDRTNTVLVVRTHTHTHTHTNGTYTRRFDAVACGLVGAHKFMFSPPAFSIVDDKTANERDLYKKTQAWLKGAGQGFQPTPSECAWCESPGTAHGLCIKCDSNDINNIHTYSCT